MGWHTRPKAKAKGDMCKEAGRGREIPSPQLNLQKQVTDDDDDDDDYCVYNLLLVSRRGRSIRECALCIYSSARASLDLDLLLLLLLLLALASFMLALIGLEKFRNFQKPSRCA